MYTADAMDPRPGFPFRLFLPMVQLLVCIAILWPYGPGLRRQMWHSIQRLAPDLLGGDQTAPASQIIINVTPPSSQPKPELNPFEMRLTAPAALNLPAGLVQVPFVALTPDKTEWVPSGMWFREWRAVSWPFAGIVFWWLAGRGLEALSAARERLIRPILRPGEVVAGLALFVAGVAACIVLADKGLATPPADLLLAAGGVLWAILGAVIVAAAILQSRIRRQARLQGIAYVP